MATQRLMVMRDTQGWRMQVWISFSLSVCASVIGVLALSATPLERVFLAIGFSFCLFASFALAKMLRDNRETQVDTASWQMTVWTAIALAFSLTGWGMWRMEGETWERAYMAVSWLFLVSSTFTVAKTVRDQHEADLVERNAAQMRSSLSANNG